MVLRNKLLFFILLGLSPVWAGNTKKANPEEEMLKAIEAAATPGENHEIFKRMEGNWTTTNKYWSAQGAPAQESKGTAEFTTVLGGRFVEEKFDSTFADKPFQGIGYTGYNNVRKKFVSSWMDVGSTGILMTEGTLDKTGKTIESKGWYQLPGGTSKQFRTVFKFVSDQEMVYGHFERGKNGREYQSLEVRYTKAGNKSN
jgi:hypothetical protein